MVENMTKLIKEIFSSDNPPQKIEKILSTILFMEIIILITNRLFPLYDCFLFIYPHGFTPNFFKALEIIFYVAFTLSTIYAISLWLFGIADCILDHFISNTNTYSTQSKKLNSTKSKTLHLAHGCESNLTITNEILIIAFIPLVLLNESPIVNCYANHPRFAVFICIMTVLTIPSIFTGIIQQFFE